MQELTEIEALNNTEEYHRKYLCELLPYFNSKNDFTNYGEKLIEISPQGHYEKVIKKFKSQRTRCSLQ